MIPAIFYLIAAIVYLIATIIIIIEIKKANKKKEGTKNDINKR